MDFGMPRKIDWEAYAFAGSQRKRVEILMDWSNCVRPTDWEVCDDLLRESWREGFKKGAGVSKMYKKELTNDEVWLLFAKNRTQGAWGGL